MTAPTEAPKPVPGGGTRVSKADVDAVLAELGGSMDRFGLDANGDWDPAVADRHTEALAKLGARMRGRLDEIAEANGTTAASFADDVSALLTERDALHMRRRLRAKLGDTLTGDEEARLGVVEAEMRRRGIEADHRFDVELLSMARRVAVHDLFDEAGYPMSDQAVVARKMPGRSDPGVAEALAAVGRDGWFPQRVVDRMNEPFRQVEAGSMRGRGGYENRSKRIHLSGGAPVEVGRVAMHEYGHAVQFAHDVQQAEFGFLRRHADLGRTEPLNAGGEVAWARDGGRWHEPYLARRYSDGVLDRPGPGDRSYNPTEGDRAFEVFTVGLETLYGFRGGAADSGTRGMVREHAEWTLGTLAVLAAQEDS